MEKRLPRGITGFWTIGKTPAPSIDKRIIENIVNDLIKLKVFRTVTITEPQVDSNFYIISLFSNSQKHFIGINSSFPYYCGIKSSKSMEPIDFYNLPEFITVLLNQSLKELKVNFLDQKITNEYINLLEKSEQKQIEYWKTENIGNVIFNRYD